MSELTLLLIRLAFLAVLWFFVIAAVGVIRTDLFGPRTAPAPARKPVKQPRSVSKPKKGEPRQLIVTGGPLQGTIINLTETPITIGRANDATLVLSDDYASVSTPGSFLRTASGSWRISAPRTARTSNARK